MSYIDEQSEKTQVIENVEDIAQTQTDDGYTPQFDDIEYEIEEVPKAKPKKKFPLQSSIIIALCVVLGAVITYLALALFIPTIEGTWVLEGEGGINTYFVIESSGDEYYVEESIGTISVTGTCTITKGEEVDSMVMNLGSGQAINCTYVVDGNRLFGDRTLTLVDGNGSEIVLKQGDKPDLEEYVSPYEDFKANEDLLGEWTLDYGMGEPAKLTFDEDGVIKVDWFGTQTETGIYTVDGNTVKRKIFYDKEYEDELPFEFTDKGLVFMQQLWTRENYASPDQK